MAARTLARMTDRGGAARGGDRWRQCRRPAAQTWKTPHIKAIYFYETNPRKRRGRAQDASAAAHERPELRGPERRDRAQDVSSVAHGCT